MLQASSGRSVKQQQEQTSLNHLQILFPGPVLPGTHQFEALTRYGKGTDFHAFNLAANTWQLHYLRLTNQLNEEDGKGGTVYIYDVC